MTHSTPRSEDVPVERFPERRRGIRAYLVANAFEWLLAIQALLTAAVFFSDPHSPDTFVAASGPVIGWVWNILYTVAGLAVIGGMVRLSPRVEAAGLVLIVAALSVNVAAIGAYQPSWSAFAFYAAAVLACGLRVRLLWKLTRRHGAS